MLVALRKESVDRNCKFLQKSFLSYVALRKESVDRNQQGRNGQNIKRRSLSARRAWIEIDWASVITAMTSVALRKESVDRNAMFRLILSLRVLSLSARRAWIEIRRRVLSVKCC